MNFLLAGRSTQRGGIIKFDMSRIRHASVPNSHSWNLVKNQSSFFSSCHYRWETKSTQSSFNTTLLGHPRSLCSSAIARKEPHLHKHNESNSDSSHIHETNHKQTSQDMGTHSHEHSAAHDHSSHTHDSAHNHDHSHEPSLSMLTHSHSHGHQPNELLSSSFSNPAVRITWIGLLVNVGLAISKGVGGVYFHSQSLVADAIHSVSDMVADFLTLATVNVATKVGSADRFPLGYGKLESVGSLLVSGVLLFAGISVGWSSLLSVFEYTLPAYVYETVSKVQIGHSHSHSFDLGGDAAAAHSHSHTPVSHAETEHLVHAGKEQRIPDMNAAWLAGGSILIKEFLFQKTMKVANETNSKVLVANAWHHRVDSLTALVAVVTVTGGNLFNVFWLDSVGGLLVSVMIIRAGWGSFKEAFYELVDRGAGASTEESAKVRQTVQSAITGEEFKILNLSVLLSGANTNAFVTLVTPENNNRTLEHLNKLEEKITSAVKTEDSFVRNIFVQFKTVEASKYEALTDDDINK